MKIAIQAADLDASRIDGTRVYIRQLLGRFGAIAPDDSFYIFHKHAFNPSLAPPESPNYRVMERKFPIAWTQISFAFDLMRLRPERLWMPIQSIPLVRPKGMKTVVTMHDLAFLHFPNHFPLVDRVKLRVFADWAVRKSDGIIAISENTKRDIMRFYPNVPEGKIRVIHHGFDSEFFSQDGDPTDAEVLLGELGIAKGRYLLYVGALQPRKNLPVLIRAFERIKKKESFGDLKLVLAGEKAWLWEEIFTTAEASPFSSDILFPGKLPFSLVRTLMKNASVFVYPSLYEGFGLPILEGFASGVPVVCADNSSLPEVGGDASISFLATDDSALSEILERTLTDSAFRDAHIASGFERLKKFSWDTCARETIDFIRS